MTIPWSRVPHVHVAFPHVTCVLSHAYCTPGCWLGYTYYDAIQVLRQTHERARDCFDLSLSALVLGA